MSRESTTYIGPYLEIISGGIYEESYTYYGCPYHGRTSFEYCPQCGKRRSKLESTKIYHHDINSMTDELVWQPEYMPEDRDIYLFNRTHCELETQSIYDLDPGTIEERIIKEIESFTEELKESGSLKALDEKGIKYEIGFGVINYTH